MLTGEYDYPPTLASQIADRRRASDTKPEALQTLHGRRFSGTSPSPGEQGGSGYPNAKIAQASEESLSLPIPGRQEGPANVMLPVAALHVAPPPPAETMMLPILRRDEEPEMLADRRSSNASLLPIRRRSSNISDAPQVRANEAEGPPMLPFGCMRDDVQANDDFLPIPGGDGLFLPYESQSSVPYEERRGYVTDTVMTPVCSGVNQRTTRPWPVPISSLGPSAFGSHMGSGIQSVTVQSSLPKWARSYSYSSPSGIETPSSLGASLTDASFARHKSSSGSDASFRWTPDAFVQCWHRKLSETYQDYNMINIVGEGRAGAVFIVQNKATANFVACKALNKKDQDMTAIRSEIETLRRLDHPNIVRLYEVNEDQEFVFLLMELCQGGDLFGRISEAGQLSEDHSCAFAQQMLSALAYCHSYGIVHRDVKPENFLLETDDPDCLRLKLADFGIATSIRPAKLDTSSGLGSQNYGINSQLPSFIEHSHQSGSLPYMAPEIVSGNWNDVLKDIRTSAHIFAASDLWGVGVVIYVMLCGCLPFGTDPSMICSGLPPDFSADLWSCISEDAVSLILALLNPNVKERWTAKQALRHKWVKDISTSDFTKPTQLDIGIINSRNERNELASLLLRSLRQWRRMQKMRRIVAAAIAKKLEASHETQQKAASAFNTFSNGSSTLKCDELVRSLNSALMEAGESGKESFYRIPSPPILENLESRRVCDEKASLTGLHVRQRLKKTFSRLTRVGENTPKTASSSNVNILPDDGGEFVSLTELRVLVGCLDGMKNGVVDYTLLVAALMTPEVYQDEARILDVFRLFDFQKKGKIGPDDVLKILNVKSTELREIKEMIKEFDLDGDGMLSMSEFQTMVSGDARLTSSYFYSAESPKD